GAGAAGGTPAGLVAALGAEMAPGGRLVAETVGLPEALADRPDLVLTGEGRLDDQSAHGKVVSTVAALAGGAPVVALAGSLRDDLTDLHKGGMTAAFSLADGPRTLDELFDRGAELLTALAEQITRTYAAAG
ncbi:MAG: glycerate kinase, partial [Streptosporangiales bacterium]|nr:glycerate kinase [Streptosporangiales bacterium]